MPNLSFLVMTCDKNIDLKGAISESSSLLVRAGMPGCIVSETKPFEILGVSDVCPGALSFVERLEKALLDYCQTKYVLILLDDYYIHDPVLEDKKGQWLKELEGNSYSALRISKPSRPYQKAKRQSDRSRLLIRPQVYAIDFHPTIWSRDDLLSILKNGPKTPWELEPLFSKCMIQNGWNCAYSSALVQYDELVVRGKFFRKPFKKYLAKTYQGERKPLSRWQNFKYSLKAGIYRYTPRWALNCLGKVFAPNSYSQKAK